MCVRHMMKKIVRDTWLGGGDSGIYWNILAFSAVLFKSEINCIFDTNGEIIEVNLFFK